MKKNKILIGVISIMFAGIIILGIIECNNSNTKDNDKLFIGNGKFCQAKRLNKLRPPLHLKEKMFSFYIKYLQRQAVILQGKKRYNC